MFYNMQSKFDQNGEHLKTENYIKREGIYVRECTYKVNSNITSHQVILFLLETQKDFCETKIVVNKTLK